MSNSNRRNFMSDVGRGMLVAGLGTSLVSDLGLATVFADDRSIGVSLGKHERLVDLMRNTPAKDLQPLLAAKLKAGETNLKELVAAGALANAVTFGGCDYVGFHTAMAMLPSLSMSAELADDRSPLPVLKVLYRNADQIQKVGGASTTALREMDEAEATEHALHGDLGEQIRKACRKTDLKLAENLLRRAGDSPLHAFNALQPAMQDDLNVHRFVFAHRTYELVGLLGKEHSYSILRQCVRLCIDHEKNRIKRNQPEAPIRRLVPKLLDQYKLADAKLGQRDPGDDAVKKLSDEIYFGSHDEAAEAVAGALAEGISLEVVGEAISLASNQFVLRQGTKRWRTHGDSAGVHSSDASNAWRNMARYAEPRHAIAGLIVAGYYVGTQAGRPFRSPAYPLDEHLGLIKVTSQSDLLAEAEDAIRYNDQARATAAISQYGDQGYDAEPVFRLMLKYAVSEDGRLHAEKYYNTVREEFKTIRSAFRWRQLVALARVTASAYGYNRQDQHGFRAAGYEEACKLLGVTA